MQVVNARIKRRLLSRLAHLLRDESLGFLEHLLNACGVDTTIRNEILHGYATDFATHRIEAADGDALGSIVDDEVGARKLLERTDIAAFTPDDAPFQVV